MNPQHRQRSMEGEEAVSSLDIGKDRRIDDKCWRRKMLKEANVNRNTFHIRVESRPFSIDA